VFKIIFVILSGAKNLKIDPSGFALRMTNKLFNLNYYLFQQINGLAGHWLWLDVLGVFLASYFQYLAGGSLFFFIIFGKDKKEKIKNTIMVGLAFLAALVARFGVATSFYYLLPQPRPFAVHQVNQLIDMAINRPSFPSGHATFFFALSMVIFLFNKKVGYWFFGASTLISLARVYVGVHYPSDILAGACFGIIVGWAVWWIGNKVTNYKKID
jgi:undecaprenyl-diphosphatase